MKSMKTTYSSFGHSYGGFLGSKKKERGERRKKRERRGKRGKGKKIT